MGQGSAGRGESPRGTLKQPTSEARPGAEQTPQWSAERRPRLATGAARLLPDAPFGAPLPSVCPRGKGREDRLPGAAKNTGADACLLYPARAGD